MDSQGANVDPRIARTRRVVLQAAGEILAERGYAGFSVDAVAERSGVAKTTIYRQWPSRAQLLGATLGCLADDEVLPDTGSVRGDLYAFFENRFPKPQQDRWGRSLLTLAEAGEADPAVAAMRTELISGKLARLNTILHRGRSRGELRNDIDPGMLASLLVGPFLFRRLVLRESATQHPVKDLIDTILDGAASTSQHQPTRRQPSNTSRPHRKGTKDG